MAKKVYMVGVKQRSARTGEELFPRLALFATLDDARTYRKSLIDGDSSDGTAVSSEDVMEMGWYTISYPKLSWWAIYTYVLQAFLWVPFGVLVAVCVPLAHIGGWLKEGIDALSASRAANKRLW